MLEEKSSFLYEYLLEFKKKGRELKLERTLFYKDCNLNSVKNLTTSPC